MCSCCLAGASVITCVSEACLKSAAHCATQASCEEAQVRDYFTRLRQNVRKFVAKLQHSASHKHSPAKGSQQSVVQGSGSANGASNGHNVAAEIEEMDAARVASMERLQQLTGPSGLLDSISSSGDPLCKQHFVQAVADTCLKMPACDVVRHTSPMTMPRATVRRQQCPDSTLICSTHMHSL